MTPDWQLPPGVDRGLWDYVSSPRVANEYDEALAGTPLLEIDLQYADRHFKTPGTLIDLGCGTGRLALRFARRGFACTAVDLSQGMLDILATKAKADGLSIALHRANLVELDDVPAASFDYAACLFSTLGMIRGRENRARFLTHVRRILRPTGLFILHAHNRRYRHAGGKQGSEPGDRTMPQHRGGADLTLHHFSRGELVADLRAAGLEVCEWTYVSTRPDGSLTASWLLPSWRAYGFLVASRLGQSALRIDGQ